MKIIPTIKYDSLAYDTVKRLSVEWLKWHFNFEWNVINSRKKYLERDLQNQILVERKLNEVETLLNNALKTE